MTWRIFTVIANKELVVEKDLSDAGIAVFCPKYQVKLRSRKKRPEGEFTIAVRPLFPGYIFSTHRLPDIERIVKTEAPSLMRPVVFFGSQSQISDDEVQRVKLIVAEFEEALSGDIEPHDMKKGDTVVVKRGTMKGLIGKVLEVHGRMLAVQFPNSSLVWRLPSTILHAQKR